MRGISHNATIGSIRAKVDGSVGYSISTPELSPEEKVLLMSLQNSALDITLKPIDNPDSQIVPVKESLSRKSQSSRIRSVIFVLWQTKKDKGIEVPDDFDQYYVQITEWLINKVKLEIDKLEE